MTAPARKPGRLRAAPGAERLSLLKRIAAMLDAGLTVRDIAETMQADERAIAALILTPGGYRR